MLRRLALPFVLLSTLLLGSKCPAPSPGPCLTPLADHEPLCNPSAVDSPWGTTHRASYAQASSPFAGPAPGQAVRADHLILPGPPIGLDFSSPYADGGVAIWGSPLGLDGAVVKIDHDTFEVVDLYIPAEREPDPPSFTAGISGAYNALDRDQRFIVGRTTFLEVYADNVPGDRHSPIGLVKREFLPDEAFCRDDDVIAGMVLTYDDHVAFVTEEAVLGVIPREPAEMTVENLQTFSINGADCDDASVPRDELEIVSNSLAADENGGIYLVTSEAMHKFRFDGESLTLEWRAAYEAGEGGVSPIRLGPGSGSTPSLMGTTLDDDRFVVITDGQELMHLVLFWRDEIPADWTPLPGRDPRIACELPVTFGDARATRSLSEQSVLVRGHAAVVVNNLLADESQIPPIPIVRNAVAALLGGDPELAPFGIERIDWDPETRTCGTVWANDEISIPNGIPAMSQATNLFYGIGQRDGVWGVEGVDFDTGESRLFAPASFTECTQEAIDTINPVLLLFIGDILERLPRSCENALFAGTEVGPDGAIVTGTFQGASKYLPESALPVPALGRADAGVRQGIDLADRALAALPADGPRALDATLRGVTQLDATLEAFAAVLRGEEPAPPATVARKVLTRGARLHFALAAKGLEDPEAGDPRKATKLVAIARRLLVNADRLGRVR
ncbi:MAG: hypothetical protein QNK04_09430 [Myxococcota bacterium]|nr:hypothetical protein [Myxococcota bacterium]